MSITFPTGSQKVPSGITALPSGVKRPAFGTLHGFDAQQGGSAGPASNDLAYPGGLETSSNYTISTNPVFHFDASLMNGADATGNPSDTASVTSWTSRINSYAFDQTTAARIPTYKASTSNLGSSGKPTILFDGGDQLDSTGAAPETMAQPMTITIANYLDTVGNARVMFGPGGWGFYEYSAISTYYTFNAGAGRKTDGSPSLTVSTGVRLLTWELNGASSYLYHGLNRYPFNGDIGSGTFNATFLLGGNNGYWQPPGSEIAEVICWNGTLSSTVSSDVVTGGEIKTVVDYLTNKYEVT